MAIGRVMLASSLIARSSWSLCWLFLLAVQGELVAERFDAVDEGSEAGGEGGEGESFDDLLVGRAVVHGLLAVRTDAGAVSNGRRAGHQDELFVLARDLRLGAERVARV